MQQTKGYRRVEGGLITSSWAPQRGWNMSRDRRAGSHLEQGDESKAFQKTVYPCMHAISTVTAHHNAWHRRGRQYVLLFSREAPARLRRALGKSEGDKVSALRELPGAILEASVNWGDRDGSRSIKQQFTLHRVQWRS